MKKTLWIIIGLVVIVALYFGVTYNKFVTLGETVDTQWSQVETQYQRRLDLIPNLVESVKGAMKQEQAVFGALADARTKYGGATTPSAKAAAAGEVETALSRLLVVMENYPTLKSSETVQTLMSQLEGTENRVSVERKRYNDEVRTYNVLAKRFPSSVVASLFGFDAKTYFEAAAGAENAPQVNF